MGWPLGQPHEPKPISLPRVSWLAKPASGDPDKIERKEIAAKPAEARVIRDGQEALEAVNRGASFTIWLRLGKALLVGKQLAVAKAGKAWGQNYSKIFSAWIKAITSTSCRRQRAV